MKIVIIVLVLVALIFILFVVRGAFRGDKPGSVDEKTAAKTDPPGWTDSIKGMFSSLQPKLKLRQKFYTGSAEETIPADEKHAFRTATFHLLSGSAKLSYEDKTPLENGNPLKKMKNPQPCDLPQDPDKDVKDRQRCSIIAFKRGGTFKFECTGGTPGNTSPCRVEVE